MMKFDRQHAELNSDELESLENHDDENGSVTISSEDIEREKVLSHRSNLKLRNLGASFRKLQKQTTRSYSSHNIVTQPNVSSKETEKHADDAKSMGDLNEVVVKKL